MSDRLRRAIARQERMRKARDRAWMVFAAFGCAALFGWGALAAQPITDQPTSWWEVVIYGLIAVFSTFAAFRVFGAARRLSRRAGETQMEASSGQEEARLSVWNEITRRRR